MTNNIKQQLFSGVFYTAMAKYIGIIISLVVAGILARLLSPNDFGTVAIATVIISFFAIFTDMGISPAVVQDKTLTEDDLANIYSFTFWTGIAIALLFFYSLMAHLHLLRQPHPAYTLPTTIRQSILCIGQHYTRSAIL